jgi:hypothetical protein
MGRGSYAVGLHDRHVYTTLTVADGDSLLLVRPAPGGDRILAVGRALASAVWQVELARWAN